MLLRGLSQQFIGHVHETIFDRRRDLARVWSWHFGDGVGLSDCEERLDLPQIISCYSRNGAPIKGLVAVPSRGALEGLT